MVVAAERDSQLVKEFESGISAEKLSVQTGLGVRRVRQILSENKAEAPKVKLPKTLDDRLINPAHQRIGVRLYGYRTRNSKDAAQTAEILKFSVKKLRSIERGTTEVTLLDLQAICKFMNLSLSELMKDL